MSDGCELLDTPTPVDDESDGSEPLDTPASVMMKADTRSPDTPASVDDESRWLWSCQDTSTPVDDKDDDGLKELASMLNLS